MPPPHPTPLPAAEAAASSPTSPLAATADPLPAVGGSPPSDVAASPTPVRPLDAGRPIRGPLPSSDPGAAPTGPPAEPADIITGPRRRRRLTPAGWARWRRPGTVRPTGSPAASRPTVGRSGQSLRWRLLAGLLALFAVLCIAVGSVTTVLVSHYLLGRLDTQLHDAEARYVAYADASQPTGAPGSGGRNPPAVQPGSGGPTGEACNGVLGQAAGTFCGSVRGGQVGEQGVVGGATVTLSAADALALAALPAGGSPRSVGLSGLGGYRLLAFPDPDNDGSSYVIGLPLGQLHDTIGQLILVEVVVFGAGLAGAGLLGAGVVRLGLRPLRRLTATASRVAELPLDRGEVALAERVPDIDPRTEVGQVGAAFNRMLDHVGAALAVRQGSETRLRQFVADASHELRTPLAAIRGYAELTQRGSDPVPASVEHALRRVQSEATRMTTLVEDMLLLARLDAGRPLAAEPVDLSRMVVDAVSDAHAASPGHHWQLDLPDTPIVVVGDQARLHQVLANLLANAHTHTPAGTRVTVSLSPPTGAGRPGATSPGNGGQPAAGPADGLRADRPPADVVELAVVDEGLGVDAGLLPHVFERFARADGSRSRRAGSTGLGLAIVAAVAAAHGGTVEVDSRPGRTAFRVRLPAGRAPGRVLT